MQPGRTLPQRITASFVFALLLLGAVTIVSIRATLKSSSDAAWVKHTQEVLTQLASVLSTTTDIETGQRGFTITRDEVFLEPYQRATERIQDQLQQLRLQIKDNPNQLQRWEELSEVIAKRVSFDENLVALRHDRGFEVARQLIATRDGKQLRDRIRQIVASMEQAERQLLLEREEATRASIRFTVFSEVVGGVLATLFTVMAMFAICRELTARRQAETYLESRNEQLAHATERAQAADRLKSAFLATMSHELRTPLNSIIGFTGILLQELAGPLNTEQHKQLGMVQSSSRHLLALINDVLDLSKIEAGELKISREPLELRDAINKAVATVQPLADKKNLVLQLEISPDLGAMVSDRRRIEQILLNLLTNAIKFTDQGHVSLKAELVGNRVEMQVSDTGQGIQPADLELLFRPFRQLDVGLARQVEGTGLGLAICRRLADLLGGEIRVESVFGEGSTFTFTLPLEEPKTP